MAWNHTTSASINVTHRTPGAYGPSTELVIEDTSAVEAVIAGSGNRFLTIVNNGPDPVLASRGAADASETNYNHVFPPGYNDADFRLGDGERLSLICQSGQMASVRVAIANEVEI
jgi:hypothetical protein